VDRWREPERARASSQVYRTFLLREVGPVAAGRYKDQRLTVPGMVLFGRDDPVIRPYQFDGLEQHADDFPVEVVNGCGHFIAEERPQLVAERALALFAGAR
jgi:pimeloyl-ACP methyl ester carboxylesterase